jgi:hypothetical protein
MRSASILACVVSGAVALIAMGCSSDAPPPFKSGTGQPEVEAAYPAGPFGVGEGSIIANYQLIGYANASVNSSSMQLIQLADFYNPHGLDKSYTPPAGGQDDRLFPPDSQYAPGQLKPTVLLIDIASVWCGPCNYEAGNVLPGLHKKYSVCGGEFLLQLADGPSPGTPAVPKNLYAWTTKYKVNYPGTIDPTNKLSPIWAADAYPENIIIDLTTMKIIKVLAGAAVEGACSDGSSDCTPGGAASQCPSGTTCVKNDFWTSYEEHLDKSRAGCMVQ